jgi:hypothetical protein
VFWCFVAIIVVLLRHVWFFGCILKMQKNMNLIANVCRFALKDDPSKDVIKAIIKLKDAFLKEGLEVESRALAGLIDKSNNKTTNELGGKKILWSKSKLMEGGALTPSTPLPVDKENGTPLVEASFPQELSDFERYHYFDDDVTNAINGIIKEWNYAEELQKNGIKPSYNYLFFGLPGTGKTELAKYLAFKLNLPLLTARLDSLLSSFLGTSARNISTLFDFADKFNCILLLDEFDAIAKYRDDNKEVGEIKRVVNTLLQRLDKRQGKGIVVATTNHEKLLDPAVWRRFQNKIMIPTPSVTVRGKIISSYLSPLILNESEKDFLSLVLDGFTPADIKNCIEFIKRFTIINRDESVDLYRAIKSYFFVNANHNNELVVSMLSGSEQQLAEILVNKIGYSIQDVSNLVGKHKSTVSRWLKGQS